MLVPPQKAAVTQGRTTAAVLSQHDEDKNATYQSKPGQARFHCWLQLKVRVARGALFKVCVSIIEPGLAVIVVAAAAAPCATPTGGAASTVQAHVSVTGLR